MRQLLQSEQDSKLRQKLTFDLSINSDPGATDDLIQLAKSDADSRVRGQALFWLAQKAGKKAIGALNASIENDPNFEVKKKAVFALSQLPQRRECAATGPRRRHQFQLRHSQGGDLLVGAKQRSTRPRLHRASAETLRRNKTCPAISGLGPHSAASSTMGHPRFLQSARIANLQTAHSRWLRIGRGDLSLNRWDI